MKKYIFLFALMINLPISPTSAQQFGLNMGQTATQIKSSGIKLEKISVDSAWRTSYLPYGNKMFDDYMLTIGTKSGLCRITAWISGIEDSQYGTTTRDKYTSLQDALNKRYGEGKEFDFLRSGAIWKDNHEWMRSMYKNERVLVTYWMEPNKARNNNLKSLKLEVSGTSPETSMINVTYEFNNIGACITERTETQNNNL